MKRKRGSSPTVREGVKHNAPPVGLTARTTPTVRHLLVVRPGCTLLAVSKHPAATSTINSPELAPSKLFAREEQRSLSGWTVARKFMIRHSKYHQTFENPNVGGK
jgi:hypothetical protein